VSTQKQIDSREERQQDVIGFMADLMMGREAMKLIRHVAKILHTT